MELTGSIPKVIIPPAPKRKRSPNWALKEKKKEVYNEMSKRDAILIKCVRAESKLKMQQMTEAHEWARREHLLRLHHLELENKILLGKLEKQSK